MVEMDFERFVVEVQSLATSLQGTPKDGRLDQQAYEEAEAIAEYINSGLALEDEVVGESLPDELGTKLESKLIEARYYDGLRIIEETNAIKDSVVADIEDESDRYRLIGEWLGSVAAGRDQEDITPDLVLASLHRYPALALSNEDYELVDSILETSIVQEEELIDEDIEDITWIATDLAKLLVEAAQNDVWLSKMSIYSSAGFRNIPELEGHADDSIRRTFNDAWDYLVEYFKLTDPNYELFSTTGKGKGQKYKLNDPELVTVILDIEEETEEQNHAASQPQLEQDIQETDTLLGLYGNEIRFASGQKHEADDPQLAVIAELIEAKANDRYISRRRMIQVASQYSGASKGQARTSVDRLLNIMGSNLEMRNIKKRGRAYQLKSQLLAK